MKTFILLLITVIAAAQFTFSQQQLATPDHIVIVIEENHSYNQIIGSSAAPYINSLVDDTLSALLTHSYAITHPSQPNYLWLFSGENQGVTNDNVPADTPFTTPNLGALLLNDGKTFAGYSENLPYTGFTGASSGAYARKHNPWVNWQDSPSNGIPASLNMPLTSFPADYNNLPDVCFVMPNQNNDMHNGSDPARISAGDTWLQNHLDDYIQWAKTNNSLFILTFDEDDNSSSNHIATLFIGQMVKDGSFNQNINHLNVLRTIEDMYNLNYAGSSGDSCDIINCWRNNPTSIDVKNSPHEEFALSQNFPNPFNPSTLIEYKVPDFSYVTLTVYNSLGEKVKILVNGKQSAGIYHVKFDGSDLASGIYIYKLKTDKNSISKKMILIK